jgi:hypothetical protein
MSDSKIVLRAIAVVNGVEKVPPSETPATGRLLIKATPKTVHYQLETSNLESITEANLHLGIRGHNGPVVANLLKDTNDLIKGELTADDLIGNLEGVPLNILLDEIARAHMYVEVVGDSVIRGQLGPLRKMPEAK